MNQAPRFKRYVRACRLESTHRYEALICAIESAVPRHEYGAPVFSESLDASECSEAPDEVHLLSSFASLHLDYVLRVVLHCCHDGAVGWVSLNMLQRDRSSQMTGR